MRGESYSGKSSDESYGLAGRFSAGALKRYGAGINLGATLESTEITPIPPHARRGITCPSSPEYNSNSEASTLTEEEHLEVIRAAVSVVNKRIPVIAGTGSNCTRTAVDLSRKAAASGKLLMIYATSIYSIPKLNSL